MKLDAWIRPVWALISSAVKKRLHELVDSIDETELRRFRQALHTRIDRL